MKLCTRFVAALAVLTVGALNAQSQVIMSDDFEGYADQAAFEANWVPIGCGATSTFCSPPSPLPGGTLSTDTAVSGTHSILNVSPVGTPLSADAAQRNQRNFADTGLANIGDKIVYSYDFYDLTPTASPNRQYATMIDSPGTGTNQLISMGVNNNQTAANSGGNYYMARLLGYTPSTVADPDGGPAESVGSSGSFFKLNDFGVGLRPAEPGWTNLKVVITTDDGLSSDFEFYVNNVLAEKVSNIGSGATAFRQYDAVRMGAGVSSASQDAYYDNIHVEYIPFSPSANDADFNEDGEIDAADYTAWRKFNPLATGATQSTGDADGNETNDNLDYEKWVQTYGQPSPGGGGSGAVPEPSTIVMLALGLAALAGRRRG
jgi:hypothetical protein